MCILHTENFCVRTPEQGKARVGGEAEKFLDSGFYSSRLPLVAIDRFIMSGRGGSGVVPFVSCAYVEIQNKVNFSSCCCVCICSVHAADQVTEISMSLVKGLALEVMSWWT